VTFVTLPQASAPEVQFVMPVWQTLPPGLQVLPATHVMHWPLLQTWLEPHEVPFPRGTGLVHACVPVAHEYVPLWHESYWHVPVPTQEAQEPLGLQTMFVPHAVPADDVTRLPQVCAPVAQVYVPVWQALLGLVHAPPAVQDTHWPELQTMLVPHEVPSCLFPRFVQVSVPELQELVPTWHGLVALVHEPPDTHAMH
jgi:hypothetical protein